MASKPSGKSKPATPDARVLDAITVLMQAGAGFGGSAKETLKDRRKALCGIGRTGDKTLSFKGLDRKFSPNGVTESIELARDWSERIPLLNTIVETTASFWDYGFEVVPEKPGKEWDAWWKANGRKVCEFKDEVWNDWLRVDVAVMFWNTEEKWGPLTLRAEQCEYSDAFGKPKLKYRHGLTEKQIRELKADKKRFEGGKVELRNDDEEGFEVWKRQRKGEGFGKPKLHGLFQACATYDSLETGENLLGLLHRLVQRHHRLGYEITNGVYAGTSNQHWDEKRWKDIEKFFNNLFGVVETSGNHDHKIEFITAPTEYFKEDKWKGIIMRVLDWAGPIGWAMFREGMTTNMLRLAEPIAVKERSKLAWILMRVLEDGFEAPPCTVKWGNQCFADARIAAELIKFGMQSGAVSVPTYHEYVGLNTDRERERKQRDHKEKDIWKPTYDAAHGPGDAAGRPPGTPDGDPQPGQR